MLENYATETASNVGPIEDDGMDSRDAFISNPS